MGATSRLRALSRYLSSFPYRLQGLCSFSSKTVAGLPRRSYFSDEDSHTGSAVYRHALKFQRPSTIKWRERLQNSVSFIGTVDRPIQKVNSRELGVYTMLKVKSSRPSNPFFKILLKMWNEMAEISIKHLRPNDFIYVSGFLKMYDKTNENGEHRTYYELTVKEINYVVQQGQGQVCPKDEKSRPRDESNEERYKDPLHLWQMFFASPNDWWDNRKDKLNPKQPDFKHKDTGEALWVKIDDPPWITRQLELHDSKSMRKVQEESPTVFDDFEEIWMSNKIRQG